MNGAHSPQQGPSNTTIDFEEGTDYFLKRGEELSFELVRNLGHGHSGNVEEVRDTRTGALYARKTIAIYGPRDRAERRKVFDNEIKIIRSLATHHHMIRVVTTYVAPRQIGLILQPVADAGDLDAFLNRCMEDAEERGKAGGSRIVTQTELAIILRAFGCLLGGLEFMHSRNIRHKDIKPRNILIHEGSVLYTDFGYSLDSSQSSHSMTSGTPSFMTRRYSAPEVLHHEERNSQSDIFSLGCVFVEMLSVLCTELRVDQNSCFGETVKNLHAELMAHYFKHPSSVYGVILDICILMTQTKPEARPTASKAKASLSQMHLYFCDKCRPLGTAYGAGDIPYVGLTSTSSSSSSRVETTRPIAWPLNTATLTTPTRSSVLDTVGGFADPASPPRSHSISGLNDRLRLNEHRRSATQSRIPDQYQYHQTQVSPLTREADHALRSSRAFQQANSSQANRMSASATGGHVYHPSLDNDDISLAFHESLDLGDRSRSNFFNINLLKVGDVFNFVDTDHKSCFTASGDVDLSPTYRDSTSRYKICFVVVSKMVKHTLACRITTNNGRATTGMIEYVRNKHCIVYLRSSRPELISNERPSVRGAIVIDPAHRLIWLSPASRLDFRACHYYKHQPVVLLGSVGTEDIERFVSYSKDMDDVSHDLCMR